MEKIKQTIAIKRKRMLSNVSVTGFAINFGNKLTYSLTAASKLFSGVAIIIHATMSAIMNNRHISPAKNKVFLFI